MPENVKIKNYLQDDSSEYSHALDEYCRDLGWDSKKLKLSLINNGIADDVLYLEGPNVSLIDIMALFLSRPETSIFAICAPAGMGKTSVRDFVVRALDSSDNFYIAAVGNPGKTPLWLLKEVLKDLISADIAPRTLDFVWSKLAARLLELRGAGITTVVWIDTAEKLDSTGLLILRSLADVRTLAGEKACKVILTGRLPLKKKVKSLFEQSSDNPEGSDACSTFFTSELEKWNADDISNWWALLSEFCSTTGNVTNPFSGNAAEIVLEFSEGKPRSIVQLTRLLLFEKAFMLHGKELERENEKGEDKETEERVGKELERENEKGKDKETEERVGKELERENEEEAEKEMLLSGKEALEIFTQNLKRSV